MASGILITNILMIQRWKSKRIILKKCLVYLIQNKIINEGEKKSHIRYSFNFQVK